MPRTQTVPEYQAILVAALRDPGALVCARFKGRQRGRQVPWLRIEIRPVKLRQGLRIQVTYHDARRAITRNLRPRELAVEVRSLVGLGFSSFWVETREERLGVQVSRRGRARIERRRAASSPSLAHDRAKARRITPESSGSFLRALGMLDAGGRIVPSRFAKYRQINEFVRSLDEMADLDALPRPIRIVDLGCGNAYLTLALFQYLARVRDLEVELSGVDQNPELHARNVERRDALGWPRVHFETCPILEFQPRAAPTIVTALHACDTATDDALARAVEWGSPLVLAAPCCHHHLQAQLSRTRPTEFTAVLRHGILRDRLGTLLTDALRAALLRVVGYRVEVIEFVAPEHTDRNLLLRARFEGGNPSPRDARAYRELKRAWGVTPRLEQLLADRAPGRLSAALD